MKMQHFLSLCNLIFIFKALLLQRKHGKGQSVPSASLLTIQSWEEWLRQQKAVLPFSKTWTGWRVGQTGS